jgi:hypothetical protein
LLAAKRAMAFAMIRTAVTSAETAPNNVRAFPLNSVFRALIVPCHAGSADATSSPAAVTSNVIESPQTGPTERESKQVNVGKRQHVTYRLTKLKVTAVQTKQSHCTAAMLRRQRFATRPTEQPSTCQREEPDRVGYEEQQNFGRAARRSYNSNSPKTVAVVHKLPFETVRMVPIRTEQFRSVRL